jgi:N-acetylglucosaminyldiphosphoundecaprenol N-acetyl-beta-D-mannosaminyltransferase
MNDLRTGPDARGEQDSQGLLPSSPLLDVLLRKAPLLGHRLDPTLPRGWASPIEARLLMGIPYGDLAEAERDYLRDPNRPAARDAVVLLRVLLARALAPDELLPAPARLRILSADVHNMTIDEALSAMLTRAEGARSRMIHYVHAHALNVAKTDAALAAHLRDADLVLPDGIGVRLAARILRARLCHNLNGTDLSPMLFRAAAAHKVPLVLIGAKPEVIRACAENLLSDVPGLEIPILRDGYLTDEQARGVGDEIRALGRCVVLVGMGTPRQERWAWRYVSASFGSTGGGP